MSESDATAGSLETPIINPRTNTRDTARIAREKVERFLKYGPAHKFYEAMYSVREALSDPDAIIAYNEDEWRGFCYARRTLHRFTNRGDRLTIEEGMVYVVFVTDTMKVVEWGLEFADRDDPRLPLDRRAGALGEVLWSS